MGCILCDVMKPADIRGLYEEIANSVSHAIGLGLASGAVSYLIYDSISYDDPLRFVSAIVYGVTILLMFVSSTLYHGYQLQPLKHYLRVFDHITIYLMIGGTLTPFILSHARDTLGYTALGVVWVLCLLGTLYKLFFFGRSEWVSVASYFLISIVGVFGVIPILGSLPFGGIAWLVGAYSSTRRVCISTSMTRRPTITPCGISL